MSIAALALEIAFSCTSDAPSRTCETFSLRLTRFVGSEPSDRRRAFADFGAAIFDSFSHPVEPNGGETLFSQEVPDRIQRFTASWLLRALTCSPNVLDFDDNQPLAARLFDRTLQQDVYPHLNLQAGAQTYEKLRSLGDYAQTILDAAMNLLGNSVNLDPRDKFPTIVPSDPQLPSEHAISGAVASATGVGARTGRELV